MQTIPEKVKTPVVLRTTGVFPANAVVGLTELDSNKCKTILRYKITLTHRESSEINSENIVSDEGASHNKKIDEFGEVAVIRLERPYCKGFSDDDIKQIISSYKSGKSTTIDLANQFKCSKNTINKLLRDHGIEIVREKAQAKLDDELVTAMYKNGRTIGKIAEHFKVSSHTVGKCLRANGVKIRSRWDYPAERF